MFNNPYGYVDSNGEFIIAIPLIVWGVGAAAPTLAVIGTYIAAGVATGAVAYGGYKLYESYQLTDDPYAGYYSQGVTTANKNTDAYAPDRPLPLTEHGIPVPETDVPHTELGVRDGSKGKYPQAREFDEKGKPVRDIDFTDHGYPKKHPNPHQHRPKPNPTGGTPERGKPEPVSEWSYL